MAQRKELEAQLQRKDEEQELQLAHMQAERERAQRSFGKLGEDRARDLAEKLAEVTSSVTKPSRSSAAHQKEAEHTKAAAEQAALVAAQAHQKLDDEREKRVAHLGQIGGQTHDES